MPTDGSKGKESVVVTAPPSPEEGTTVVIITLGGTIASKRSVDNIVSILDSSEIQRLLHSYWPRELIPRIAPMAPMNKLSENMHPHDWVVIARTVREVAYSSGVQGVAILHGTDTMAFTSAALSILLHDCPVPIVLTGSLLTTDQPHSDAAANLRATATAVQLLPAGVYVCFDQTVHLGTNVRKISGTDKPQFVSLNRRPVAHVVGEELEFIEPKVVNLGPLAVRVPHDRDAFDTSVLSLALFPGMSFQLLDPTLRNIRGLVVELYVSATAPNFAGSYSLPQFVKERCAAHKILLVATLPASEGGTPGHPSHVYTSTLALEQAGALIMDEMTREVATVKLMWALAQSRDLEVVRALMQVQL